LQRIVAAGGLPDNEGKIHRLSDCRGRKVVLYFCPKDNTPGCTKETRSFRDYHGDYQKYGIVVLGVSPDSVSSHEKFAEKYSLQFPLLADPEHKVLETYGIWQLKTTGGKKRWGVKRTTYIIEEQGKIFHVLKKVNTAIHAQEVSEALGLAGGSQQGDCVELSDELRALAAPGLSVHRPGRSLRSAERWQPVVPE